MKSWDVVIAGGGIIGLSLARELKKHGVSVLVVERGEPGREASHAAAGMLAYCDPHLPEVLRPLARATATLYPEFVHEIEDESGMRVDLRTQGTILYEEAGAVSACPECVRRLDADEIAELEPRLEYSGQPAYWTPEGSVDPRALVAGSLKAAKHRGIDIASGSAVTALEVESGRAVGVKTAKTRYAAAAVVNCCGAWACEVAPVRLPTRPVKGQMLCVVGPHGLLRHVVRAPEVYVVPRSDGRMVIGSTLEDAGYDKRVQPDTIQHLHQAAANLVPELREARMLETWAGIRPGTPDSLPLLGETEVPGYFVAAGHYRDGILLAPVTAQVMGAVVRGLQPDVDISAFAPGRFRG